MPKKNIFPVSPLPTSMRFNADDQKALELARQKISREGSIPPTVKLTPTDILRTALAAFVKDERPQ